MIVGKVILGCGGFWGSGDFMCIYHNLCEVMYSYQPLNALNDFGPKLLFNTSLQRKLNF